MQELYFISSGSIGIFRHYTEKDKIMRDLQRLADEFEALTKTAGGSLSRKDIAKQLEKAKKEYQAHKARHDDSKTKMDALQVDVADANDKANNARKDVLKYHYILKNMDLSGADEVKHFDDDIAYVRDKKMYLVTVDADGNCKMTDYEKPAKKSKKEEKAEKKEKDEVDTNDAYDYLYSK